MSLELLVLVFKMTNDNPPQTNNNQAMTMKTPTPTCARSICMPPGAKLIDACNEPLELLEDYYFRGPISSFDEADWFHVALLKRLFAKCRRLNCLLDAGEVKGRNLEEQFEIFTAMSELSPSKLLPNNGIADDQEAEDVKPAAASVSSANDDQETQRPLKRKHGSL